MKHKEFCLYIGNQIQETRYRQVMSQAEVAEESGLHVSTISHYETGRRTPSLYNILQIAKALNTSVDFLIWRYLE